jgi:hypothetical protein
MRKSKAFWNIFFFCQVLALFFVEFDFYYQVATSIFIYQAVCFFDNLGKGLNIRYLIGLLYSLNYLFGPMLMYSWLNPFVEIQYTLKGDPDVYFSYVIPAILCMLAGLHIFAKKGDEYIDVKKVNAIVMHYPNLPLYMIVFGVFMGLVAPFLPGEVGLLTSGLAQLRFVGFFIHILTTKKFNFMYFAFTYGLLMLQSVLSSMFNDLLNLLFFLGIILAIRLQPSRILKLAAIVIGVGIVFGIQIIKVPLRSMVVEQQGNVQVDQIEGLFDDGLERNESKKFEEKIANVISRASQGWITSNVLRYYYDQHGFKFQEGAHIWIMIQSSVLPRVIAPDKYLVGDIELFNTYSGHTLHQGTAMALGVLSDGFIDFGRNGIFVCFWWGLVFSYAIYLYNRLDKKFPLAKLLSPLCFFYAIRPDTDVHSALGSVIKITIVLWLVMLWFKRYYFPESFISLLNKKFAKRL